MFFGGGAWDPMICLTPNEIVDSDVGGTFWVCLPICLANIKFLDFSWNVNSGSEKLGNGASFGFSFKNQPKTGHPPKKDRSKCYHLIKGHTWAPPPKARVPPNSSVSVQFSGPLLGRDKESKGKPRALCFPGLQCQDWEVYYWGGTGQTVQTLIC